MAAVYGSAVRAHRRAGTLDGFIIDRSLHTARVHLTLSRAAARNTSEIVTRGGDNGWVVSGDLYPLEIPSWFVFMVQVLIHGAD